MCTCQNILNAGHTKRKVSLAKRINFIGHNSSGRFVGTVILTGIPKRLKNHFYQDIYKAVWTQVSRLVSPLPPRDSGIQNHATDW